MQTRAAPMQANKPGGENIVAVIIFGASGDLTSRKVAPALNSLRSNDLLPESTEIIGIGRSEFTDEQFREKLRSGVEKHSRAKAQLEQWKQFSEHFSYLRGNYDDPHTYQKLNDKLSHISNPKNDSEERSKSSSKASIVFYLATPPNLFETIVDQIGKAGLSHSSSGKRSILIEKPYGRDYDSARSLSKKIHSVFREGQIYRIDHYLGKDTVQNILTFRFANTIFEPLWNRNYIDHIQITVAESIGVEHRAGYYDKAGVARDMLQNHLLQLVALSAMEPPVAFNAKELRDEKVKIFRALRLPRASFSFPGGEDFCVWGQYEGYRDEQDVGANSNTPTFVALKLFVNNWRWQGVPFFLRTGKKLKKKCSEIIVQFKRMPLLLFPEDVDIAPNKIVIRIQPDEGLELRFEAKKPGMGMSTVPVEMKFQYDRSFGEHALPEAYEHLLLDSMQGDASMFSRSDAIELAWSFVDPIIESVEKGRSKVFIYKEGSWGPDRADTLIADQGSGGWYLE
ncbi:MAG: glucose-6-phosphate dehydrogenase [Nitrososphaerales archaeon]